MRTRGARCPSCARPEGPGWRALVAGAVLAAALAGCGADERSAAPAPAPPVSTAAIAATPRAQVASASSRGGDPVAQIVHRTQLHGVPGGRVVAEIGTRTEWGTPRYLPVVRRRGDWLGVIATERPNARLGWVRASATKPAVARSRITVDLSDRRLWLLDDRGRTLLRIRVAIGAAGTPTPMGRYAVTDGLRPAPGSPYGCCILALSGHQPNVPQGWEGGDRLAIHGTDDPTSIGSAASHGCLRADERDLRRLMARVGLGTLVEIRA